MAHAGLRAALPSVPLEPGSWTRHLRSLSNTHSTVGVWSGASLFLLRDLDWALQRDRGPAPVLICIPCLEVCQAQSDTLLGFHELGHPLERWAHPIDEGGKQFIGPY